jgi:hypothetical protein
VTDATRIAATLPTLRYVLERDGKLTSPRISTDRAVTRSCR